MEEKGLSSKLVNMCEYKRFVGVEAGYFFMSLHGTRSSQLIPHGKWREVIKKIHGTCTFITLEINTFYIFTYTKIGLILSSDVPIANLSILRYE